MPSSSKSNDTLLSSTFYLLTLVAPHVSPGVLRAQLPSLIAPLGEVLSNTYSATPSTDKNDNQAALLRSSMGVLEPLLLALSSDRATLSSDLQLRGCWNSTLRLCLDARPKVRKRAQDLVSRVLQTSKEEKAHPFASKTAEWAISALDGVGAAGSIGGSGHTKAPTFDIKAGRAKQPEVAAAARQKHVDSGSANSGIWICGFLKQLSSVLPNKSIPTLSSNLLRLLSQKNPYLSTAAFEVFESLFKTAKPIMSTEFSSTTDLNDWTVGPKDQKSFRSLQTDSLITTLDSLCSPSVEPKSSDMQLIAPYLSALESGMVALSRADQGNVAWKRVPGLWKKVFSLSFSSQSKASRDSKQVRSAGRSFLSSLVRYCIPDSIVKESVEGGAQAPQPPLFALIGSFDEAFDTNALRYSHSWPEIMGVLASFILRLRYRLPGNEPASNKRVRPAAVHLLMQHVKTVGFLRSQPNFEHREQADTVIGAAIQVCGPASVLEVLPLNLLGEVESQNGRAWLLPLMRSNISNTDLQHFVNVMVPLSEKLFNKQAEAEEMTENGKPRAPVQAKVYEALTEQIWALLPGYCDLPVDLPNALSPSFVELLANVLYSQSSLRPPICRALQLAVERSQSLAKSSAPKDILVDAFGLTAQDGKVYVQHLSAIATNLLAVLFNIFSQSPGENRGFLSDCMVAYLSIMTHVEIAKTYEKIVSTLNSSLSTSHITRETGPKSIPPISHTMLDLLILLVPFMSLDEAQKLYTLVTQEELLVSRDSGLQKKTYRLLAKLMEGPKAVGVLEVGPNNPGKLPELLSKLQETTKSVVAGAKRDRTSLLTSLVPLIPTTEFHILPSLIPEAVLATKEVNQSARDLAYQLLVQLGHRIEAGGQIKRHLISDTMDDVDEEQMTVKADLNEYITMVAAGLVGSSPHMISATITALARLVYEFHNSLPIDTLNELVATVQVFMESANREVAKSTIGFVKVIIVSLPSNVIEDNLKGIVGSLLSSNNQHRIHFKAKIRHIFERLLRRFGFDRIESLVDEDNRKLIVNIRKRKERSRRKKASLLEDGVDQEATDDVTPIGPGQRAAKRIGADAFEEAIYGSDSDLSDDSEYEGGPEDRRQGQEAIQEFLMQDDDAPIDLLDRSAAASGHLMHGDKNLEKKKRRPGQEASHFALDEKTGRMIIDDPDEPDTDEEKVDVEGVGRAYLDRERGTHGIVSKDGKMRLNKNNKRNREADDDMEKEQMALEERLAAIIAQKQDQKEKPAVPAKKRKEDRKQIGEQFRAKKAGGDIKRGSTSPFAYVPLGQIGGKNKKGGQSSNVHFLSRDKKRRS